MWKYVHSTADKEAIMAPFVDNGCGKIEKNAVAYAIGRSFTLSLISDKRDSDANFLTLNRK